MSIKLMVLPARLGVRHKSMMSRSEKTALPAPIMLIFTGTKESPEATSISTLFSGFNQSAGNSVVMNELFPVGILRGVGFRMALDSIHGNLLMLNDLDMAKVSGCQQMKVLR